MRIAILLALLAASMTLAGCVGTDDGDDGSSAAAPAKTYPVPITAAHATSGLDRTVRVQVLENGDEIASESYATQGNAKDVPITLVTVTVAGPVQVRVYDGEALANVKTVDPTTCVDPDIQIHLTNDAVHLFSNCD